VCDCEDGCKVYRFLWKGSVWDVWDRGVRWLTLANTLNEKFFTKVPVLKYIFIKVDAESLDEYR